MPRILAIDYGLKRTGIAWTDTLQMFANGLGSVDTPDLEETLRKRCAGEQIEAFLLGYPSRMDGSDTHATEPVRQFELQLNAWFPAVPVIRWDERFTSKRAMQVMVEAGVKKKQRRDKHLINQVSATLMLQEYLESRG